MLTKKQLTIFQVFVKKPFEEYTLKHVKELSEENSNNALSIAMKQYKKENLLNEKKVGRSSLFTINFENDKVFSYFELINNLRTNKLTNITINRLKESILKHTSFFSIIIFGSYAVQNQNKESDLDIMILIENEKILKEIERAIKSVELKSVLKMDVHVITDKEFLEMLTNEEENLGKQIARKHMTIYNNRIFYSLIEKGYKNGFRI